MKSYSLPMYVHWSWRFVGCFSVQSHKDPRFSVHDIHLPSGSLSILLLQLVDRKKKQGLQVGLEVAHVTSIHILLVRT